MENLKLRAYDGIALTGFLILPAIFMTGLSDFVRLNHTASHIVLAGAALIMLCIFLLSSTLIARFKDRDIIEITRIVLGRPITALYGIALTAYFCFFTGIHIRESTEVFKFYTLGRTPVYIVAGIILLTAVILNFFGGMSIVKSAGFFFVIAVAGTVLIILLAANGYNADNLAPWLGYGYPKLAYNTMYMISMFDGVMLLFLFAPAFSEVRQMQKSGVLTLLLTAVLFILVSTCYVMVFPAGIGSNLVSGVLEMGKSSYYNHFFYRFESFFLFFLIFSAVMQATVGLFIACKSVTSTFHIKRVRSTTVICAVAVAAAIFLPSGLLDLTRDYLPVVRQYSALFIAGFPPVVLLISTIKRIFKYEKA